MERQTGGRIPPQTMQQLEQPANSQITVTKQWFIKPGKVQQREHSRSPLHACQNSVHTRGSARSLENDSLLVTSPQQVYFRMGSGREGMNSTPNALHTVFTTTNTPTHPGWLHARLGMCYARGRTCSGSTMVWPNDVTSSSHTSVVG